MKILYVVSTLKRSGPTNQLYSLIKHIDKKENEITVLTLSPEPEDSRWSDFELLGVKVKSLGLSRISGFLLGKKKFRRFLKNHNFDLIHSQGIRADSLVSKFRKNWNWFITSHNNPYKDYLMKFGKAKGMFMAWKHAKVLRTCKNVISCSKTIKDELTQFGIKSNAIQNGVELSEIDKFQPVKLNIAEGPIFISVGSLIERKNMELIIKAFNDYSNSKSGFLIIVGDGPQREYLEEISNNKTLFTGNIDSVPSYLKSADYFISSSKAEGLPYTVLEALAADLPILLSDIPSHREIKEECGENCTIFPFQNSDLTNVMNNLNMMNPKNESRKVAENIFSAKVMSQNYYSQYLKHTNQ